MYLTVKQQLKHLTKSEYETLRELSHIAKDLTNQALYCIRQYYFTEKKFLRYEKVYALLKTSDNYKLLNSNMAQQILKSVDSSFQSFFGLLKLAKKGRYRYQDIRLPKYLAKDGYAPLIIGMIRINQNQLTIPYSQTYKKTHDAITITIPPILQDKTIKEIRIIPKQKARFFEIQYTYEIAEVQRELDITKALAIDLGINNFVTGVTNTGDTFIIDGRRLKSWNQWYHKEMARLKSISDRQVSEKKLTKREYQLLQKRNRRVYDFMHKSARYVIDYCIAHQIGTLVIGYNHTFQQSVHIGRKNHQIFLSIPFGTFREMLSYLCQLNGITFVEQEESYTSKASFFDKDKIPVYNDDNPKEYSFSGKRISRGMYQCKDGMLLNADVNGALNILRKSKVVSLDAIYDRGAVNTPIRKRLV